MATSGTVGQTTFETRKLVDRAYRLCKVPSQMVTSEMLQIAMDELYLLLSSLANTGIPMWCIKKQILPLYYGQIDVPMPAGTVSILQAVIREVTRQQGSAFSSAVSGSNVAELAFDGDIDTSCILAAPAGHIGLELSNPTAISTVGILASATGTWSVILEYSEDGINYTPFYSDDAYAAEAGKWQWFDFQELPQVSFWRLRAGAAPATTLAVAELVFANNPSEILMGNINKDDYFNLPNKTFTGKPLQYWQNRQIDPIMKIWPAAGPEYTFYQVVVNIHQAIQDVGTLRQSIDMPHRWFDPISLKLGAALARVTAESKLGVGEREMLIKEAEQSWRTAWAEERDPSPISLGPDISMYTR